MRKCEKKDCKEHVKGNEKYVYMGLQYNVLFITECVAHGFYVTVCRVKAEILGKEKKKTGLWFIACYRFKKKREDVLI